MSGATQQFGLIRREFENSGIRNPELIAEHVSALLLTHAEWDNLALRSLNLGPNNVDAILRKLRADIESAYRNVVTKHSSKPLNPLPDLPISNVNIAEIIVWLEVALKNSDQSNWGDFYQREIRSELLKSSTGSQYPTPHHIAQFMADIGVTIQSEKIADPTVGSGGLLVAARKNNPNASLTGFDFSAQWASFAFTNLFLHNVQNIDIQVKQSTELYNTHAGQYDCVLMNPPFGGSRHLSDALQVGGGDFGRTTSTLLAAVALHMLKENGIAIFLAPSGVLFGGGGEDRLRSALMSKYHLEAVITLPKDALQPYSSVATHLFSVREAGTSDQVWFCELTDDGYPGGASRDLTTEPNPAQNELPRTRDLVVGSRNGQWETILDLPGVGKFEILKLGDQSAGELHGMAVQVVVEEKQADFDWEGLYFTEGVLVYVRDKSRGLIGWFYSDSGGDSTVSFPADKVQGYDWTLEFGRNDWEQKIPLLWQGSVDNVSLSIEQNSAISLEHGRTAYKFSGTKDKANIIGCLVRDGQAVTPWLKLEEPQKLNVSEFGKNTGAITLKDAFSPTIGWILDVNLAEENGDGQAQLLIARQPKASLFQDDTSTYVFMDNGLVKLQNNQLTSLNGTKITLRRDVPVQGFAIGPAPAGIDAPYSLFGVLVHRDEFFDGLSVGDIRPSRFLPEPEAVHLGPPMEILASIRKGQTRIASRVDRLLGILGQSTLPTEEATRASLVPDWLAEMLNDNQHELLTILQNQNNNDQPRHFSLDDVVDWCRDNNELDEDKIQQQLILFGRMGLIVEVSVQLDNQTDSQNLYRLVTQGDVREAGESL